MIWTLLLIAVLVIGILGLVFQDYFDTWVGSLSITITAVIGSISAVIISILILVPSQFQSDKIAYETEMTYLESIQGSSQFTSDERIKAVTYAMEINRDIQTTRVWRDNPWVNWFYAYEYGDFELIDLKRIPWATMDISIDKEGSK